MIPLILDFMDDASHPMLWYVATLNLKNLTERIRINHNDPANMLYRK